MDDRNKTENQGRDRMNEDQEKGNMGEQKKPSEGSVQPGQGQQGQQGQRQGEGQQGNQQDRERKQA